MAVERSAERDAAIVAMLPHVPFDGWTRRALRAGLADIGVAREDAEQLFPGAAAPTLSRRSATWPTAGWRRPPPFWSPAMRLHQRVRAVIALRLEQNRPHKEAIRRALALLALPGHVRLAATCTARTVDAIWRAAGDRSADFSWYTRRAILAAVFGATLLVLAARFQ